MQWVDLWLGSPRLQRDMEDATRTQREGTQGLWNGNECQTQISLHVVPKAWASRSEMGSKTYCVLEVGT